MDTKGIKEELKKRNIPADVSPMISKRTELPLLIYVVKTNKIRIFKMTKLFAQSQAATTKVMLLVSAGEFPK